MNNATWIAAMAAGLVLAPAAWATTSFQLDPVDGFITGDPGQTVGWGFTLFNDTNYLLIANTEICPTCLSGTDIGLDLLGYSDIVATTTFQLVGLTTMTTFSQTFDSTIPTGVGEFTINPSAIVGDEETNTLLIDWQTFTDDTGATQIASGQFTVNVIVEVVPEPATFGLAGIALAGFAWMRRSRRRAKRC